MALSITVRMNRIPAMRTNITDRSRDTVRSSAEFMRDYAASIAPVRTSAFAGSIYVNGPGSHTDYIAHAALARQRNPTANIIPELQAAQVDTGMGQLRNAGGQFSLPEAIVASAVEYSLYLEEGTRYMAPRPTFRPAAEATRRQFAEAMSHVAD